MFLLPALLAAAARLEQDPPINASIDYFSLNNYCLNPCALILECPLSELYKGDLYSYHFHK